MGGPVRLQSVKSFYTVLQCWKPGAARHAEKNVPFQMVTGTSPSKCHCKIILQPKQVSGARMPESRVIEEPVPGFGRLVSAAHPVDNVRVGAAAPWSDHSRGLYH